ncbi:Conserved_hypothetical protein [Hexamita inflata]|uniref:Uncharacterized protein n=1 Tax=Hexamita inflata TaxID=28002 RepID=A0AA86U9U7_9EUKA|nr:Conserved hypothetical protein [Hexamita inflata]
MAEVEQQFHKIYYNFAYDPKNVYTMKFRAARAVSLNFIRSLLISLHGIEQAAMCALEICDSQSPDTLMQLDAMVQIGAHLIVRRVPITEYKNTLKNIIDCFGGQQKKINLDILGISPEELDAVIQDNSGQNLKQLIDDLKQKFMIEDDQLTQTAAASQINLNLHMGSRARAVRHKVIERVDESESESEEFKLNANEALEKLENKDTIAGQWFRQGKVFRNK